jgi:1-phosphofructokinase family hexose kinase
MSFLTVCLNPTLQKTLRFSSVVPGTVNRTANHRLDVSGKGINVTRVLTQLGKKALHLTQLGGSLRPLYLSLCEQDGLSVEWVESESLIRFCYTLLTDGNVTELVEEAEPVAAETEKRLLEKFESLFYPTSNLLPKWLIISGTKAAGFSDKVFPEMVRNAKEKGLRIILDIRGNDLIKCLKYEPDIIKPNLDEFIDTYKTEPTKDLLMDIAIKNRCRIILTNGNKKILAADGDNYFETEIQPIKAVNSIGCGDAFTAGLAAALEDGAVFSAAINEGIRCGALNAGFVKPGVIR